MDEHTRRRWENAPQEELDRARAQGELSPDDYRELQELRHLRESQGRPNRRWLTALLVVLGLSGLGVLIFCGGCGLILTKPWIHH